MNGSINKIYLHSHGATSGDGKSRRVYNVGSDVAVSILELAKTVSSVLNPNSEIIVECEGNGHVPNAYVPKISRAERELGLEVRCALCDAISRSAGNE